MIYSDVRIEERLQCTTADVLFTISNQFFSRKIAVEAKDRSDPLTSTNIAEIDNLYRPSLNSKEVDSLIIVGNFELACSPRLTITNLRDVEYFSEHDFILGLMNFSALLHHNIAMFDNHIAAQNFIPGRKKGGENSLYDVAREWISKEKNGLLIYGGYGLGKTVFSLYLARELSRLYLERSFGRIPVRIALGQMYTKHDIVSLICSTFTSGEMFPAVPGFSYGLFIEMNRAGYFVLIFDGFDEMRHAMDINDFVFIFEQMQPLFQGFSKVVLLGRPDSFLTDKEENRVIQSLLQQGTPSTRFIDELEVDYFNKAEITKYLDSSIARRKNSFTKKQAQNYADIVASIPENEETILSRPVQLKMFTEIIDRCLQDNTLISRYEIYYEFLFKFARRESTKIARRAKNSSASLIDERITFMVRLAWWLFTEKKENRFEPLEVPSEIIPLEIRAGIALEAAVREALVGSIIEPMERGGVLDRKAKRYYFFPHKSYLEFLAARYLATERLSVSSFKLFMSILNNEILSFIDEGPLEGKQALRQGLDHILFAVDFRIAHISSKCDGIADEIRKENVPTPARIYVHYAYFRRKNEIAIDYLIKAFIASRSISALAAASNCIAKELQIYPDSEAAKRIFVNCFTALSADRYYGEEIILYHQDVETFRATILSRCFKIKGKYISLSLDMLSAAGIAGSSGALYMTPPGEAAKVISPKFKISDIISMLDDQYQRAFSALTSYMIRSVDLINIKVSVRQGSSPRINSVFDAW